MAGGFGAYVSFSHLHCESIVYKLESIQQFGLIFILLFVFVHVVGETTTVKNYKLEYLKDRVRLANFFGKYASILTREWGEQCETRNEDKWNE